MYTFELRAATPADVDVYLECFQSEEYCKYLEDSVPGAQRGVSVFSNTSERLNKYIVYWHNGPRPEKVGYIHISLSPQRTFCEIGGGLRPRYLNTGMGIYTCFYCISFIFRHFPGVIIKASTFSDNSRSLRMLQALGFEHHPWKERRFRHQLAALDLNNPFVKAIGRRVKV